MNGPAAGYTLLEMVVVMSVLAMATAVVAPMGSRMIETWRNATQVQDVVSQIEHLPSTARDSGSPLDSGKDGKQLPLTLPAGWSLDLQQPLHVLANGACSSATATLITTTQRIDMQVEAPFCHVRRDPA